MELFFLSYCELQGFSYRCKEKLYYYNCYIYFYAPMEKVVLHLGSNMGDRAHNLDRAISYIQQTIGTITRLSSVFITEAWGVVDQPDFLNQVVVLDTMLSPENLIQTVQKIETIIGKEKEFHWGPRYIDIDVLFFGSQIINKKHLRVPHPEIQYRNFVLVPLNEIEPDFIHPVLNKSIDNLTKSCDDTLSVAKYKLEEIIE